MCRIFLGIFCAFSFLSQAQNHLEKYPVFEACEEVSQHALESCFNQSLHTLVTDNFVLPEGIANSNYVGVVNVLFEVSKTGEFVVLFIDNAHQELKDEARRVFENLPKIQPPTYNGEPTYMQFTLPIRIPFVDVNMKVELEPDAITNRREVRTDEYDAIINLPYENDAFRSNLNIPLSHHEYSRFDPYLNRVGTNTHTAQKPYIYQEVNPYYDFDAVYDALAMKKTSWLGR